MFLKLVFVLQKMLLFGGISECYRMHNKCLKNSNSVTRWLTAHCGASRRWPTASRAGASTPPRWRDTVSSTISCIGCRAPARRQISAHRWRRRPAAWRRRPRPRVAPASRPSSVCCLRSVAARRALRTSCCARNCPTRSTAPCRETKGTCGKREWHAHTGNRLHMK